LPILGAKNRTELDLRTLAMVVGHQQLVVGGAGGFMGGGGS